MVFGSLGEFDGVDGGFHRCFFYRRCEQMDADYADVRLRFWVGVYNLLTIRLISALGLPKLMSKPIFSLLALR